MKLPKEDNSVDGVYQIEAACHSPTKLELYKEIFRVMKPGTYFAGYEWVMTDKYDNNNQKHRMIKKGIEIGNGIADLEPASNILGYMVKQFLFYFYFFIILFYFILFYFFIFYF